MFLTPGVYPLPVPSKVPKEGVKLFSLYKLTVNEIFIKMSCQNFFNLSEKEIRKIVRENAKVYESMLLNYDQPAFPFEDNYLNKIINEELGEELKTKIMRQLEHDFKSVFYTQVLTKIQSARPRDQIRERTEVPITPISFNSCKPCPPIKPARKKQ